MEEKRWIFPGMRDDSFALISESNIKLFEEWAKRIIIGRHHLGGADMKIRIIINTTTNVSKNSDESAWQQRSSEVWRGDIQIKDKNEYLTKISIIADGQEHPICDIPFAIGIGHWLWVPPDHLEVDADGDPIDSNT